MRHIKPRRLGAPNAVWVAPDRPPRPIGRARRAGSPLEHHTARPGGWYALLQLPVTPALPMELVLWLSDPRDELRLSAMDAPPDDEPGMVDQLPLEVEAPRDGRPARLRPRFALPPDSAPDVPASPRARRDAAGLVHIVPIFGASTPWLPRR